MIHYFNCGARMRKLDAKEFQELVNYSSVRTLYMMLLKADFPVLYTDIEEHEGYRIYDVQLTPDVPTTSYKGLKYKLYAERND